MTNFYLIPTCPACASAEVAINIQQTLEKLGKSSAFFHPILQNKSELSYSCAIEPLSLPYAEDLIGKGRSDDLVDSVVEQYHQITPSQYDAVVITGLQPDSKAAYLGGKNKLIAGALNAKVILLIDADGMDEMEVVHLIRLHLQEFADHHVNVLGYVLQGKISAEAVVRCLNQSDLHCVGTNDEISSDVLQAALNAPQDIRMSPASFRFKMMEQARAANKRIVLPEGAEPRTVRAAVICHEKNIARCVLLATQEEVQSVAKEQGITLPESLEIIDPKTIAENYVAPLVEKRKSKGLTPEQAREALEDTVVLGTMMMALDEVDGLVSGAVHTTANTIRPALQLIKTAPGASLVSSVFFMLMPDQVYVYGDCAVNPNPTAEQLADIAIQSADSAKAFGIDPRVAMISYSTGTSGAGPEVEKVDEATKIALQKRPDLLIDGPLQYDAACVLDVGRKKAPDSKVAGQATVFVFPDLNTGNTTYKAVQRSANVLSVGPMLQGLNKPVNDLSRGALVDDIVYTIALTAIQAVQMA